MLILAHRGYHAHEFENSLPAFAAAAELGVDGIETDLRLSADGRIVLFHDRLAPGGDEVAALSHDELNRRLGYPVPELREALEAQPQLLWNLEIKVPAVLDAALPILKDYAPRRRLLITSFWHNVVDRARRLLDIPCGLLEANRPAELSPLLTTAGSAHSCGAGALRSIGTAVWSFEMIDPELLEAARAAGVRNWCYGVQTLDDHRRAVALKLDAVITDDPQALQSLL